MLNTEVAKVEKTGVKKMVSYAEIDRGTLTLNLSHPRTYKAGRKEAGSLREQLPDAPETKENGPRAASDRSPSPSGTRRPLVTASPTSSALQVVSPSPPLAPLYIPMSNNVQVI